MLIVSFFINVKSLVFGGVGHFKNCKWDIEMLIRILIKLSASLQHLKCRLFVIFDLEFYWDEEATVYMHDHNVQHLPH